MEVNKDLIDELILLEDRNVGNLTNLTILTFIKYFGGIIYFWLLYIHIYLYYYRVYIHTNFKYSLFILGWVIVLLKFMVSGVDEKIRLIR
jgi:hypothetical protein